jgi:hypothetical protein
MIIVLNLFITINTIAFYCYFYTYVINENNPSREKHLASKYQTCFSKIIRVYFYKILETTTRIKDKLYFHEYSHAKLFFNSLLGFNVSSAL